MWSGLNTSQRIVPALFLKFGFHIDQVALGQRCRQSEKSECLVLISGILLLGGIGAFQFYQLGRSANAYPSRLKINPAGSPEQLAGCWGVGTDLGTELLECRKLLLSAAGPTAPLQLPGFEIQLPIQQVHLHGRRGQVGSPRWVGARDSSSPAAITKSDSRCGHQRQPEAA